MSERKDGGVGATRGQYRGGRDSVRKVIRVLLLCVKQGGKTWMAAEGECSLIFTLISWVRHVTYKRK